MANPPRDKTHDLIYAHSRPDGCTDDDVHSTLRAVFELVEYREELVAR
jgi:hypothetical protein